MPTVGATVDKDEKDRWESYIEDNGIGTISELIRVSVRKQIRGDGSGGGSDTTVPRELKRDVNRIAETQREVRDAMAELRDEFDDVREETQEWSDETKELAQQIAGDLPEMKRETYQHTQENLRDQERQLAEKHLDELNRARIRHALEFLEENLNHIVRTDQGYHRLTGDRR